MTTRRSRPVWINPTGISRVVVVAMALLFGAGATASVRAEIQEVKLARGFGIAYLPFMIIEHDKLIAKHAKRLGLQDLKVGWTIASDGAIMNEGILSGNLHVAVAGIGAFLAFWSRSQDTLGVKGIASMGSMPLFLNTRNPNVNGIKDFTDNDRIAIAGATVSPQATTLQFAAAQTFGDALWNRLDRLTVNMAHPIGMQAMLSGTEINSHFTSPPYQYQELETPGVRTILKSYDVWGGKHTFIVAWASTTFRNENPKTFEAIFAAIEEATKFIAGNKRLAADIYLKVSLEKETLKGILTLLGDPDIDFELAPRKTQIFADFKFKIGAIKKRPESWKDMFFPNVHALPGD